MLRFLLLTTLLVYTSPNSWAGVLVKGDIVKLNWANTNGHAQGGGEFRIWKLVSPTGQPDQWQDLGKTFCLEFSEHLSLDEKLVVGGVSDRSVFGGLGGQVPSGGDPLDLRTKYLMKSYADGTLRSAYPLPLTDDQFANAVQQAIWKLEDEIGSTTLPAATHMVNNYVSGPLPAVNGVFALNLFSVITPNSLLQGFDPFNAATWSGVESYRRQDQLFYDPAPVFVPHVPEPTTLVVFIGMGLVGVIAKRNLILKRSHRN